jgi:hypothetical protein
VVPVVAVSAGFFGSEGYERGRFGLGGFCGAEEDCDA